VALITSLASARGKRVGDFLAGTVVVRERMPAQGAPVAAMPPPLAGWATTLDLGRVPDDLALAARQFLGRFQDLAPEVRESMGSRLAAAMAAVTTPPPPPGVPAWAFLSAVLAERRRREMARMLPPAGYQPMSPYGGHQPVAQPPVPPQLSPVPSYGESHQVATQPPAEEVPPQRDGNPFTPPG
jgi:hypothetical protein